MVILNIGVKFLYEPQNWEDNGGCLLALDARGRRFKSYFSDKSSKGVCDDLGLYCKISMAVKTKRVILRSSKIKSGNGGMVYASDLESDF